MEFEMLFSFLAVVSIKGVIAVGHGSSNWTTCAEFVNNTVFKTESVLDIDWSIFYFWTPEQESPYNIRFSRPTKGLVDRFITDLDKEIVPSVNWTDAELFMETSIDFSALYLRTNVSGIYRLIPVSAFEFTSVPLLIFGIKVVKPGYLGIANCKHRLCYGLAPFDKMPREYELEDAAKALGFYSDFNRTHVSHIQVPGKVLPNDDLEEDYDPDMEMDPNKLDLF